LKAHETIVLNVEFTSFLPQIFERTGYEKSFHLAAQWYPKLAKREVNGTWAHFAFHPYGEFYADFGNYEVSLDVPQDFVVGSTGRLRRLEGGEAGRALYQATATGVHDFAWTAWPEFIVEERSIAGVQVRLLSPANLPLSRQATWKTLERSLPYLEENYGPYPYRQLTVVHPPAFASPAGGMEYPQFITTGGSDWVQALGIRAIELVTVHELGHQWFQGVIATDEMSFPFLDEGLASYAEWRYLTDTYGSTSLVSMGNLRISRIAAGRYTALLGKFDQPIELPASSYESFSRIGSIVYGRMPLALETWARVYSPQKMRAALSGYAKKFRFKHPRPRDFYHTVQMQLGQEAGRALKHYFRRGGTIDLSVGNIETRAIGGGYQSSIQIRRQGDVALPFEVVAEFADRSRVSKAFSGEAKDLNWSLVHESKLESLVIDPEHRILLDENLLNNRVMVRHKKASDHPSFSMRVFAVISFLLAAAAF
jgi:hypothetical protein